MADTDCKDGVCSIVDKADTVQFGDAGMVDKEKELIKVETGEGYYWACPQFKKCKTEGQGCAKFFTGPSRSHAAPFPV